MLDNAVPAGQGCDALSPDLVQARAFLSVLDPDATAFTFQTFDDVKRPDGRSRGDPSLSRIRHGSLDDLAAELAQLNARGAGVFVAVNETDGKGRTAANIVRVRAIWHEWDSAGALPDFPIEPSAVVETSPGKAHRYWPADGLTPEQHAGVMRTMVARYGSDPNAKDISRVLRLPGFYHMKNPARPFRVRLLSPEWAGIFGPYPAEGILNAFPPMGATPTLAASPRVAGAAPVVGEVDTPAAIDRARAMLADAPGAIEGAGGDAATYNLACRVLDFGLSPDTAAELMAEVWDDKCAPPWGFEALLIKCENAARYKQDPIGRDNTDALFPELPPMTTPTQAVGPQPRQSFAKRVRPLVVSLDEMPALPRREWLADRRLIRGKLSEVIAAGGVGKSLLTLQWAVALALGNGDFCRLQVRERVRVLLINLEDDFDELRLRLAAMALGFGLPTHELGDWLHTYEDTRDGFKIAKRGSSRQLERADIDDLETYIRENDIGAVIIDPLVEAHQAKESDNDEMSIVMQMLRSVAQRTRAAIAIVHHTRKPQGASAEGLAGNPDSGRGATAVVNAARVVSTLFDMTESDAKALGVSTAERRRFVRLDDAKANLSKPDSKAEWFERASITLPNGESIGVLKPVEIGPTKHAAERMRLALDFITERAAAGEPVAAAKKGNKGAAFLLTQRHPDVAEKHEWELAIAMLLGHGYVAKQINERNTEIIVPTSGAAASDA